MLTVHERRLYLELHSPAVGGALLLLLIRTHSLHVCEHQL